jgi:hypothetical protein
MVPADQSQPDDLRNTVSGSAAYESGSFQYHLDLWMGMPLLMHYTHPQYLARRLFAHTLRDTLRCDGIEFTSSQIEGSNLVIFPSLDGKFPLRYIDGSVERCWVTDRPVYAETF